MKTLAVALAASASFFLTAAIVMGVDALERSVSGDIIGRGLEGLPAYIVAAVVCVLASGILTRALKLLPAPIKFAGVLIIVNVLATFAAIELVGELTTEKTVTVFAVITGFGLQVLAGLVGSWLGGRWTARSSATQSMGFRS